ncbi:MAG TPA: hypothetical protein ENG93_02550 [Nitrospirae bacterium]|nr:hypothetical protein [Nitrospirota bacterium]
MKGLSSRAIIGIFYEKLAAIVGASWVGGVSMDFFDSDMETEEYKWLGMSPAMREWIGGRQAKGLRENGISIKNKKWESTLEILVDDLRRDKTGQIRVRIADQARRANSHWASLLSTQILNGESNLCYDGQYFFDTDHEEGDSGTQDNDLTVDISALPVNQHGSVAAPSPEEMELVILQGVQQILSFKDDQGEPMNEDATAFDVLVPVPYLQAAIAATRNPVLTSGKTSTIVSSDFNITAKVNPRLTWTDKLAIFRTDGDTKAFIRQEEQGVSVSAIAEGSEMEFKEDKHYYGLKALRNVGYGFWQKACQLQLI